MWRIIIRILFITVGLALAHDAQAEEDGKVPASTPSDYKPDQVKIDFGPGSPAKKIDIPPFELRGATGYYTNSRQDQGFGFRSRVAKSYFLSSYDIGPRVDLLMEGELFADYRFESLLYSEADFLGLTPGAIWSTSESETVTLDWVFLLFRGHFKRDVYTDHSFVGMRWSLSELNAHLSFGSGWDSALGIRFMDIYGGYGKIVDKDHPLYLGMGSGRITLGKDLGFMVIKPHFLVQSEMTSFKGREEGETRNLKLKLWHYRAGLKLDRLFGSHFGLEYDFHTRYFDHNDFVADGVSGKHRLGQHFVSLTAQYH